ncbi:acyltransferase family protein [Steroidobacter cummioxidans]|uniref:acyltransferase family protein n=1 Tax=Steroidobacter cummioxidans TaxID=1803913 RepID=UPI000E31AECF|nr:acyltransferase [Steroidobacter cummioxidans]
MTIGVSESPGVVAQSASMTAAATEVPSGRARFEFIDGLRGVAAIMVAIGHLAHAAADRHPGILGPGIEAIASLGRYGVQIFFVLSGFVIAHSVTGGEYSFKYFGRFAARRFVRLDLPYWSVIALEMALLWLSGQLLAQYSRELPSFGAIAANAFYLQNFLGYPHILPVFWTLCYEVQFYLVLVLSLVLLARLRNAGVSAATTRLIATAALSIGFLWSVCLFVGLLPPAHPALFFDRWFQFALGVIIYLYYRGHCGIEVLIVSVMLCLGAAVLFGADAYRVTALLVTVATAVGIVCSLHFPRRGLLEGASMQFLGRISYSLYLLHLAIGWRATVLVRELIGSHYSTAWAYFAFAVGMAASIVAAWIANVLIEQPAIRLARTIDLPKRRHSSAVLSA